MCVCGWEGEGVSILASEEYLRTSLCFESLHWTSHSPSSIKTLIVYVGLGATRDAFGREGGGVGRGVVYDTVQMIQYM